MLSALKRIENNKEPTLTRGQAIQKVTVMFEGRILSNEEQQTFTIDIHATVVCPDCFRPCHNPIELKVIGKNHITLYKCANCQNEFWKQTFIIL